MEGARAIDGVTFGSFYCDDLYLTLASKDLGCPKAKVSKVEVPGSSVTLDFTEAFGDVQYSNRTIKLTFLCLEPWADQFEIQREVRNKIHGKRMNIIFDEDASRYFSGRVSVDSWEYYKKVGKVQITVDADPWLYHAQEKTLSATNVSNAEKIAVNEGRRQLVPKISCSAAATVKWYTGAYPSYVTHTVSLSAGNDQVIPQLIFKPGNNYVYLTTTGTITFSWQEADL